MVTDRRHTEHGNERKQQLLVAAQTLFGSRGYARTRIADICGEAGVAKGLFYWYFPTKESLFAELVESMRMQLRRAQATAMDDSSDPITRIRQGTQASVRFIPRSPQCSRRAATSTNATSSA
jgi:AcrR family transcriptional regulator